VSVISVRRFGAFAVLCAAGVLLFAASQSSARTASPSPVDGKVTPMSGAFGSTPQFRTSRTIPYWGSSFVSGGTTYAYTMVGTDPASGGSTTVSTVLVPLKFVFSPASNVAGGNYSDVRDPYTIDPQTGQTTVAETLSSPIFQPARFPDGVGTTQFGDALQRAEFDQTGRSGYHLLLGQPTVLPEITETVPANQAEVHEISGRIDEGWFSNVLDQLTNSLHLSPTTVPIFLTYNVLLWQNNDRSNCCLFGFHTTYDTRNGNGDQQVQTSLWASWVTPGIFSTDVDLDVSGLSHEVAEWANDPFLNNAAPSWDVASEPQYGCQSIVEVGDPLVGSFYPVTLNGYTYHLQNEALLPWFARESPSPAANGAYSYPDTNVFTSPSTGC
jgi:hypothetical protein